MLVMPSTPVRTAGFTLVEVMVVVVILAILLGVGVPNLRSFIESAKVRTTAESIQAGLNLARMEAMRRNVRVSFWLVSDLTAACVAASNSSTWVVSQDTPATRCTTTSSDTDVPRTIQTRPAADESRNVALVATDSLAAAASCITFDGFGLVVQPTCTGGGATITQIALSSANTPRRLQVRITDGGAIRMCDPDRSGTPAGC
jgi:type IV fimbrial biogenesis protein FimT